MSYLTKGQALSLQRRTEPLKLRELPAPLLVAEMSGRAAFRLQKVAGEDLETRLVIMVADMVVTEDGARMFTQEEVPDFLERISVESSTALLKACTAMQFSGGDPGNSQPSTSAA